jgi:hypothetical protein
VAVLGFVRRRPLACYFALVYLLSGAALVVIGLPKPDGMGSRSMLPLVMFPVMVIGVTKAGQPAATATTMVTTTERCFTDDPLGPLRSHRHKSRIEPTP